MSRRSTGACLEGDCLNSFLLQSVLSATRSSLLTILLMQEKNTDKILTPTPQHSTFFSNELRGSNRSRNITENAAGLLEELR